MNKLIIVGLVLFVVGCDKGPLPDVSWHTDQGVRQQLFERCMDSLPAGPQSTKYNDWDEVVDSCYDQATWTARFCVGADCPPGSEQGAALND